jgi:cleavage stimulation factor subunit 3
VSDLFFIALTEDQGTALRYSPPALFSHRQCGERTATMSLPPESAASVPADDTRESVLSPTSAASLPSNPLSNQTIKAEPETPLAEPPADLPAKPPQPRTLGGFEVDDDEDESENAQDDGDDDGDVYDPEGLDLDASTPALQAPLDRQSQSPPQTNGNTPVPAQPTGSPTGVSSSVLPPGPGAAPVTAESPAPALTNVQAQVSDPRPNVNGPFPSGVPRSRLSHDTIGILEDRIKEDPRGDPNAYLDLISEYKSRNKQDEVRETYQKYLAVFPTDVSFHIMLNSIVMLTGRRHSNGVHLCGGKKSTIVVARWSKSSTSLY